MTSFFLLIYRLENLFHSQGVDLIIEAHEHSYERLWPVFNHDVIQTNYINPRGSVHVISGAAGNQEGKDNMVTDASEDCLSILAGHQR